MAQPLIMTVPVIIMTIVRANAAIVLSPSERYILLYTNFVGLSRDIYIFSVYRLYLIRSLIMSLNRCYEQRYHAEA